MRNRDIISKDSIDSILTKTMHSRNRGHGMIFIKFKKCTLNIRNSCLSVIKLKRDSFSEIMRTVFAYKSVVMNNQNNRQRTKREVPELNRTSTFRDMMVNSTTMRTSDITNRRFKINEHS